MKYGSDITKRFCEELIKVPSVRIVCAKLGIDHSTFYRWMAKHHTFYKKVTVALAVGRDRMCEAAESVIIRGIQNNDFKAATYWLAHNSPRYGNLDQHRILYGINKSEIEIVTERRPEQPEEAAFEFLFKLYEDSQKIFDPDHARTHIEKYVKLMCHGDTALEEIFFAAYQEWKKDKDEYVAKDKRAFPDEQP